MQNNYKIVYSLSSNRRSWLSLHLKRKDGKNSIVMNKRIIILKLKRGIGNCLIVTCIRLHCNEKPKFKHVNICSSPITLSKLYNQKTILGRCQKLSSLIDILHRIHGSITRIRISVSMVLSLYRSQWLILCKSC